MKITIDSTIKIQASFRKFADVDGCELSIYFYDGERYQHDIDLGIWGCGEGYIHLINLEDNTEVGTVHFKGENPTEESYFNHPFWASTNRNKESCYIYCLNHRLLTNTTDFQYVRNGW